MGRIKLIVDKNNVFLECLWNVLRDLGLLSICLITGMFPRNSFGFPVVILIVIQWKTSMFLLMP